MATTIAELEKRIEELNDLVHTLSAQISATQLAVEDATPFVGYVTTKYIGDGLSKEWQTRPALLIGEDRAIVIAPDDEGGVYTVYGAVRNDENHIPGTWHTQE